MMPLCTLGVSVGKDCTWLSITSFYRFIKVKFKIGFTITAKKKLHIIQVLYCKAVIVAVTMLSNKMKYKY